jgi:hypothetical protein
MLQLACEPVDSADEEGVGGGDKEAIAKIGPEENGMGEVEAAPGGVLGHGRGLEGAGAQVDRDGDGAEKHGGKEPSPVHGFDVQLRRRRAPSSCKWERGREQSRIPLLFSIGELSGSLP